MEENKKNTVVEVPPLSSQIMDLYDDFLMFNNDCTFLFDAFSALAEQLYLEGDPALRGIQQHTLRMKNELHHLALQMRSIQLQTRVAQKKLKA